MRAQRVGIQLEDSAIFLCCLLILALLRQLCGAIQVLQRLSRIHGGPGRNGWRLLLPSRRQRADYEQTRKKEVRSHAAPHCWVE